MMGFGLMGAGAAVKGLVSGYQQGRKFAQDEERFEMEKEKFGLDKKAAEQVGRLRDAQIEGVGLANRKSQSELDDADEDRRDAREMTDIFARIYNPPAASSPAAAPAPTAVTAPSGGITPPSAPAAQVSGSPPAALGLAGPGGAASPPAAQASAGAAARAGAPSLSQLEEAYSRANAIGLRQVLRKQGPAAAVQQAITMARSFGDAKADAAIRALSMFDGSNDDQVKAALADAGLAMPEGTRFERREIEVIPGSGYKTDDVVAVSPDGKQTRSLHQMMRSRMSPKEVFDMNTQVGKAVAEIAQRKTAEENLHAYRTEDLKIKGESAANQAEYYLAMLKAREKEVGFQSQARADANEAQAELRRSQASRNALGEIMQLSGVSRETSAKDMEMLSDQERVRVQTGLAKSFTAHTIWSMNRGNLSPAEALEVGKRVAMDPKAVKMDDGGQAFIQFGGKNIFVPAPMRPAAPAPAPAPGAAPTPAPAAPPRVARPGIATPASQLPPQAEQAGAAVDAARQRVAAASRALQMFGSRQRQQDPSGYEAARQALESATSALEQAEAVYQRNLPAGLNQAFSR